MATTIYKQSQYVRWDAQGNVITSSKGGSVGGSIQDFMAMLMNYYTKTQLQTSGSAQVHWDNIINKPADIENIFQYSLEEDSIGIVNLVGDVASPGNSKVYGTDGTGARGWYDVTTFSDYMFVHSIVEESAGHVSLENDAETPGNSKLYGTNNSGVRGWYDIPVVDSDFTPGPHNTTHENGGSDEISVLGLSGLLADGQTPLAHVLNSTSHTVSGLSTGYFLKATGATTFGFAAHGLTYTDVGAAATAHTHTSIYAAVIHNLVDTTNHPVTGLTNGHFLKATGSTTYAFGVHGLTYSDVSAAPTNHNFVSSTYHSVAGLTIGDFLKATSATTFDFATHGLTYVDVNAVGVNGTPIDNQIAVWINANVVEGTTGLTYDGTTFYMIGNFQTFSRSSVTKLGVNSYMHDVSGSLNVAIGYEALHTTTTGSYNAGIGARSLIANTEGNLNSVLGYYALRNNTTGSNNIAIGYYSGTTAVTSNYSIFIGDNTTPSAINGNTNEIVIGYQAVGTGSNTIVLGHTSIIQTTLRGTVLTDATTTTRAGLRLPHGTAPTSPVNGDIWTTTDGLYARINGGTVGPFGTGGGSVNISGTPVNDQITVWTNATTVEGTTGLTYDGTTLSVTSNLYALSNVLAGVVSGEHSLLTSTAIRIRSNTTTYLYMNPSIADGSTAIAYAFDTVNTLTTTAKIASFKNNGSEVAYITQDGTIHAKDFVLIP